MGWVKLDDGFWLSEKMEGVSDKAFRLYVRALSYAGQNLTDGAITKVALRRLESMPKVAGELVAAGLWNDAADGWEIHDYLVYNESRQEREQKREEWRRAGKKGAARRWGDQIANPIAEAMANPIAPPNRIPDGRKDKTPLDKTPQEGANALGGGFEQTFRDPDLGRMQRAAAAINGSPAVSGIDGERIVELYDAGVTPEWFEKACSIARENRAKNPLKYAIGVAWKFHEQGGPPSLASSNSATSGRGRSPSEPGYRGPDMDALLGQKP